MSEKSDAANDHLRQLISELALCLHRLLGSCSHDGHHYVGLTNKLGSANLAHAGPKSFWEMRSGPSSPAPLNSGGMAGARGFEPRSSEVEAQCPVHWTTRPYYGGPDRT